MLVDKEFKAALRENPEQMIAELGMHLSDEEKRFVAFIYETEDANRKRRQNALEGAKSENETDIRRQSFNRQFEFRSALLQTAEGLLPVEQQGSIAQKLNSKRSAEPEQSWNRDATGQVPHFNVDPTGAVRPHWETVVDRNLCSGTYQPISQLPDT